MRYKHIFFIVFLIVLSLLYTWYEANRPQPVDWSETYSPEDKIPYGTYILYQTLPRLFPEADIVCSRSPFLEESGQWINEKTAVYIFVGRDFNPGETEWKHLLEWVEKGNQLFVSARYIADTLLHTLALQSEVSAERDGSRLLLPDCEGKVYEQGNGIFCFLKLREGFRGRVLGERVKSDGKDFVGVPYGKGEIFLNLHPQAFTNVEVLDSLRGDYCYRVLSCVPIEATTVVWAARHTLGPEGGTSPLRVILHYPALRLAWYILLVGALLYVLFKVKREQRPIPVIRPPENKMLEFIETVSLLYWKQKDHYAIAVKHIAYLKEEIQRKYLWQVEKWDEQTAEQLAVWSGVEKQQMKQWVDLIRDILQTKQANARDLKILMKGMERLILNFRF